ncbi:hypothetical protein MPSEU_000157900 [Mayamaea pseudoterrestris]|nr:hypothetical protein MPSEU_000157900 [Mayamaea pseudoterrestris]
MQRTGELLQNHDVVVYDGYSVKAKLDTNGTTKEDKWDEMYNSVTRLDDRVNGLTVRVHCDNSMDLAGSQRVAYNMLSSMRFKSINHLLTSHRPTFNGAEDQFISHTLFGLVVCSHAHSVRHAFRHHTSFIRSGKKLDCCDSGVLRFLTVNDTQVEIKLRFDGEFDHYYRQPRFPQWIG